MTTDDSEWRQPPSTSINKSDDNDHPVTNGYHRWSMSLRLSLTHPQPSVSIRGRSLGNTSSHLTAQHMIINTNQEVKGNQWPPLHQPPPVTKKKKKMKVQWRKKRKNSELQPQSCCCSMSPWRYNLVINKQIFRWLCLLKRSEVRGQRVQLWPWWRDVFYTMV